MDIGRREEGGGELYSGYREKGRRRRTLQWIYGGREEGGGELYSGYMEEGKKEEENFTVDIWRKGRRRRTALQWI